VSCEELFAGSDDVFICGNICVHGLDMGRVIYYSDCVVTLLAFGVFYSSSICQNTKPFSTGVLHSVVKKVWFRYISEWTVNIIIGPDQKCGFTLNEN